jgi:hypothetical protein
MDMQTEAEKKEFEVAKEALKEAQKSGDEDAKKAARDEYKKKLARLVHWDGHT